MDMLMEGKPLSDIDRIASFENAIVEHAQLTDAREAITALRKRSQVKAVKPLKARALLVVGDAGSGKSTILENYYEANQLPAQSRETLDGEVRPVISLEMPPQPTRRQVVSAILHTLGYPASRDWNTEFILTRISELFRKLGVELVMIDEAHHIVRSKSEEKEEEVAEFLKSLLNRSGAQFVLSGLPDLLKLEHSKQMERRLEASVFLRPYRWDTLEGRNEFRVIVERMEEQMVGLSSSNLSSQENAVRLYCATGGHVGLVSKFLSEAYRRAMAEKLPTVDLRLLGEVHSAFANGRNSELELSDDWEADALLPCDIVDAARNPFLAKKPQFSALWTAMKTERNDMSRNANRRKPRKSGVFGLGSGPTAF